MMKFGGILLLVIGIGIILFCLYFSFNVFTGQTKPPEIFNLSQKEVIETEDPLKTPTTEAEIQKELEKAVSEKIKEIIPTELISRLLNLMAWSLFAWILISAGTKIAGLGIDMIKD